LALLWLNTTELMTLMRSDVLELRYTRFSFLFKMITMTVSVALKIMSY